MAKVEWLDVPEEHDYPAAESYLSLLTQSPHRYAVLLQAATNQEFKVKDILRASFLPLLDRDNEHVRKNLKKIEEGERLSPILLVRGSIVKGLPLHIADGYHRVCAAYHTDENTLVPARIV